MYFMLILAIIYKILRKIYIDKSVFFWYNIFVRNLIFNYISMVNLERKVGKFDEQPLEIVQNPEKPVVQAERLATGVLKVKRGEKEMPSPTVPGVTLEEARAAVAQIKEIGRKQGGTSQGSPGAGGQKGGYNYRSR
jgi:hypothetical protein